MPAGGRIPPGRAGRVWARGRLRTARRGAEILDRKLRILTSMEADLRAAAARTEDEWERRRGQARLWSLRAALLGGQRELRQAALARTAHVDISWTTTMGIRVPATAACEIRDRGEGGTGPVSAAVTAAAAAHEQALAAACRHAAAAGALARVSHEVALTRRRLRAIERRWIPRLEGALADLETTLEQREREDGARLRRAREAPRPSLPPAR
jgi:V/A-type H+-transporting ATPase subunit D